MKSVLLSIKPKYCQLIASGKKTIEVRKTKPKLDTPFKCYIYCTKDFYRAGDGYFQGKYCGKVIGEFVCNCIGEVTWNSNVTQSSLKEFYNEETCLTDKEVWEYTKGNSFYEWHISNLVIYDKPKELKEFYTDSCINFRTGVCVSTTNECVYLFHNLQGDIEPCVTRLKRPPQSWCYVEKIT